MEKIRGFLSKIEFSDVKKTVKENLDLIKKITLPAVVALAVVLFWVCGGEEELIIESGDDAAGTAMEAENEDEEGMIIQQTEDNPVLEIYVDIGGEVLNPGVYKVSPGTRLFQVIEKAGGLKETADTDNINQAEHVTDGQKIIIGSLDENSPYYTGGYKNLSSGLQNSSSSINSGGSAVRETEDGTVVNINSATLEELQMIPGVGPSTAKKILDFRDVNGRFNSPEDLKKISGIGDKTYDNLKDYIEV
jgi:competence protein ComEA